MKLINKHIGFEYLIYLFLWVVLFCTPLVGQLFGGESGVIEWDDVYRSWIVMLPVFVLFVLNNFCLVPCLLLKKRPVIYVVLTLTAMLLVIFLFKQIFGLPQFDEVRPPFMEDSEHPRGFFEARDDSLYGKRGPAFQPDSLSPPMRTFDADGPKDFHRRKEGKRTPKPFIPGMLQYLTALLVLALNVGVKYYFRSIKNDEWVKGLEKERLQSELDHLRYQINPHFFMNTLNNIHALIDVDRERAQSAILELSKLMRHVLYETAGNYITLDKEILFLNNYIDLMRLRYIDGVAINISFPTDAPPAKVPPLLFVVFVENAFKYGVSYVNHSFINVNISVQEERLIFSCENTFTGQTVPTVVPSTSQKRGIGIANAEKRLSLLYGSDFILTINQNNGHYSVLVNIPLL